MLKAIRDTFAQPSSVQMCKAIRGLKSLLRCCRYYIEKIFSLAHSLPAVDSFEKRDAAKERARNRTSAIADTYAYSNQQNQFVGVFTSDIS